MALGIYRNLAGDMAPWGLGGPQALGAVAAGAATYAWSLPPSDGSISILGTELGTLSASSVVVTASGASKVCLSADNGTTPIGFAADPDTITLMGQPSVCKVLPSGTASATFETWGTGPSGQAVLRANASYPDGATETVAQAVQVAPQALKMSPKTFAASGTDASQPVTMRFNLSTGVIGAPGDGIPVDVIIDGKNLTSTLAGHPASFTAVINGQSVPVIAPGNGTIRLPNASYAETGELRFEPPSAAGGSILGQPGITISAANVTEAIMAATGSEGTRVNVSFAAAPSPQPQPTPTSTPSPFPKPQPPAAPYVSGGVKIVEAPGYYGHPYKNPVVGATPFNKVNSTLTARSNTSVNLFVEGPVFSGNFTGKGPWEIAKLTNVDPDSVENQMRKLILATIPRTKKPAKVSVTITVTQQDRRTNPASTLEFGPVSPPGYSNATIIVASSPTTPPAAPKISGAGQVTRVSSGTFATPLSYLAIQAATGATVDSAVYAMPNVTFKGSVETAFILEKRSHNGTGPWPWHIGTITNSAQQVSLTWEYLGVTVQTDRPLEFTLNVTARQKLPAGDSPIVFAASKLIVTGAGPSPSPTPTPEPAPGMSGGTDTYAKPGEPTLPLSKAIVSAKHDAAVSGKVRVTTNTSVKSLLVSFAGHTYQINGTGVTNLFNSTGPENLQTALRALISVVETKPLKPVKITLNATATQTTAGGESAEGYTVSHVEVPGKPLPPPPASVPQFHGKLTEAIGPSDTSIRPAENITITNLKTGETVHLRVTALLPQASGKTTLSLGSPAASATVSAGALKAITACKLTKSSPICVLQVAIGPGNATALVQSTTLKAEDNPDSIKGTLALAMITKNRAVISGNTTDVAINAAALLPMPLIAGVGGNVTARSGKAFALTPGANITGEPASAKTEVAMALNATRGALMDVAVVWNGTKFHINSTGTFTASGSATDMTQILKAATANSTLVNVTGADGELDITVSASFFTEYRHSNTSKAEKRTTVVGPAKPVPSPSSPPPACPKVASNGRANGGQ